MRRRGRSDMDPPSARPSSSGSNASEPALDRDRSRRRSHAIRLAAQVVLLGLICHFSTVVGYAHKLPPHSISVLWPTGAILLSVLVVAPVRRWWAYILAAYFSTVLNDALNGFPVAAVLFVTAGLFEIVLAAIGIRVLAAGVNSFDNRRDLVVYILVGVILGPFLSAFIAACAGSTRDYWFYWRVWFLSEALGYLTLTPAILTLMKIGSLTIRPPSLKTCVEIGLIGVPLFAICAGVFGWPALDDSSVPALVYLPLPIVLWAAVRYGPPGVNLCLLIVAAVSITGTVHGHGPFASTSANDNVIALQLFLVAMSVPLMFLGAVIAEGRQQTKSLTESEARFRSMADTAPVMIWMADTTKGCTYVNKPWLDFTGRTIEHEVGDGWAEGVHADDRDRCWRVYTTAFDARERFDMEYRLRRWDGEYRWVVDCGRPRSSPDGEFLGYIGSCIDIAERKKAEEELRASHEEQKDLALRLLRAQEVERRRLAREMHDDLSQRLAVLAIEVTKLERSPALWGADATRLGAIREQLVALSEDVHDLSRQLHPAILDDLGLVDALRSECSLFQEREGIEVRYRVEGVSTNLPRDVCLALYRIAQESLRNVARHSGASRADVTLVGCGVDVMLVVSDEGKGFAREGRARRAGIGLAGMEERARLIGAELTIQTAPGKGTTVTALVAWSGGGS